MEMDYNDDEDGDDSDLMLILILRDLHVDKATENKVMFSNEIDRNLFFNFILLN